MMILFLQPATWHPGWILEGIRNLESGTFWRLLLLSLLLRLSSSFSNRICIIEQYLLAAADAEEEAERRLKILLYFPSFLSSSFLETLVCQEEWLLSSLWLFFYFPDTSQCLNNVTKVSLLSYTYTSSPDLVKSLKLNNFGFGQLREILGPFWNTVFFWSIQEAKTNAVVSERA